MTGGEIVKGSFNDTEEVSKVLENLKNTVSLLKGVTVETSTGSIKEIFVMPKQEVKQEENTTEQLEKGKDADQLEKGKIKDALYYSELKIVFSKTGKEIKEKLATIKAKENSKLIDIEAKLSNLEDKLTHQPTEKYSYEDADDTYKTFKWEMTYVSENASNNNVVKFNDTDSGTLSNDECKLNREWNDLVYSYRDVKGEIDSINLLEENLEDNKKYELTARQMLNFGF